MLYLMSSNVLSPNVCQQDLKGNRGFPEDARHAANQKLQAEVIPVLSQLLACTLGSC